MSWKRSLSIKARITLGSVLIALIAVSAAAFFMHRQIAAITHQAEIDLAQGDLASIESGIRANPRDDPNEPASGILVYIRTPNGKVPVDTVPSEISAVLDSTDAVPGVSTFRTEKGLSYTLAAGTVKTRRGTWELWAARSGDQSSLTNAALDRTLVLGSILLIGVFGGAAWLFTTLALRPVARMQRTARTLSLDANDGELPVGPARDVLTDLALTLNAFIQRMRDTALRERQMVSAASHELRTPIAVITTQLELAHKHFGNAEALEAEIRAAERTLDRLARLARNLLELSRVDAATPDAQSGNAAALESELMEAVDRGRLVSGVSGPEIELATEIADPHVIYGLSVTAFSRILDNLVSNALQATPQHGRVLLKLTQHEHSLVLAVGDTGHGIPEDFIPHAFERFTRPDEARTASSGGSGLGLALVHAIVSNAGGTAAIANVAGGGIVVTLTFPALQ